MSWALESSDSTNVFVTGTVVPSASPALEVVCALREVVCFRCRRNLASTSLSCFMATNDNYFSLQTKRMPKPMLPSYRSIPTLAPSRLPHPPQVAGMSWSFSSYPQHDQQQTLTRSADFPEVYIGPPRRARGRPEGSTSSRSKVKAQTRASSLPGNANLCKQSDTTNRNTDTGSSPSKAADSRSEPKQAVSKQKTKPKPPRPLPTYSPFICAPLTRNVGTAGRGGDTTSVSVLNEPPHLKHDSMMSHSQNQSHVELDCQPQSQPHPTHNLLVGLLSALSSASGTSTGNAIPEQQAALISVLQGLLVANPHISQPPVTAEGLPANKAPQDVHGNNNAGDEHDDGDSDIVILDSSTIDTTMFRKASARQPSISRHGAPSFTANQESPMPSNEGVDSSPLPASTPPSVQENISTWSDPPELLSIVVGDSETPNRHFPGWVGKGDDPLDMPTTPTPSRTRKRKLDEYSQGLVHWSTPLSPSSPSPSVVRTSISRRAVTSKNQAKSSPTGRRMSMSSPSMRLPSMLGSMRGLATSSSPSSSSPIQDHATLLTTEKKGNQSTVLVSKSRADHGITPDASSLKRRRTLTEFMAEQEARKSLKARKLSSSERKLGTGCVSGFLGRCTQHSCVFRNRGIYERGSTATC